MPAGLAVLPSRGAALRDTPQAQSFPVMGKAGQEEPAPLQPLYQ